LATELIGWAAAMVLIVTLGRQVWVQWRERRTQGVSKWLFIGQCAASVLFVLYSWLLGNWVFVVTNLLILATAATGEAIYLRNRRLEARRTGAGHARKAGTAG
jgi:MtN3 and saliva related transmembrane protein